MVQRFAETRSAFEAGGVAHALAAALRDLLSDWHLFVTQLEHQMRVGKLTLQVAHPRHASASWLFAMSMSALQIAGSGGAAAVALAITGAHNPQHAVASADDAEIKPR